MRLCQALCPKWTANLESSGTVSGTHAFGFAFTSGISPPPPRTWETSYIIAGGEAASKLIGMGMTKCETYQRGRAVGAITAESCNDAMRSISRSGSLPAKTRTKVVVHQAKYNQGKKNQNKDDGHTFHPQPPPHPQPNLQTISANRRSHKT